jgi:hypothetical protein
MKGTEKNLSNRRGHRTGGVHRLDDDGSSLQARERTTKLNSKASQDGKYGGKRRHEGILGCQDSL